jgi:hypothetical protein
MGTEAAFNITRAACPFVKKQTVRRKVSKSKKGIKYKTTQRTCHISKLEAKKPDLDTADLLRDPPLVYCVVL